MAENKPNATLVLKADAVLKEKLKAFYADDMCEKAPQYATFQAKTDDCTVTLYDSGKLMFQGKRAEEEGAIWSSLGADQVPKKASAGGHKAEAGAGTVGSNQFSDTTAMGSDEVGTGDFFGPIVVTAAYVTESQFPFLTQLGVRDSKKLSDDKIQKIGPEIMEAVPHVTKILSNPEYNEMRDKGINMNQIKAILHNACLLQLGEQPGVSSDLVVVDQFEPPKAYYNHLAEEDKVCDNITFMTKAEDQCMAVACGSIISRYIFLGEMRRLGQELGYPEGLPFGAGSGVDGFGAELMADHGEAILPQVAKMNFANVQKVRDLYDQTR